MHPFVNPYKGLARGRCIGASAIPVSATDPSDDPYRSTVPNAPQFSVKRLSTDDTGTLYNLGYAILRLDGASGTLDHFDSAYEQPILSEVIV